MKPMSPTVMWVMGVTGGEYLQARHYPARLTSTFRGDRLIEAALETTIRIEFFLVSGPVHGFWGRL